MKFSFIRNLFLFFFIAVLIVGGLLFISLPFAGRLILPRIVSGSGLELQFEDVSGNIFNHLTLTGVKGSRIDPSMPIEKISADYIRVDYSLFSILRGEEAFLARTQIKAAGLKLVLDIRQREGKNEEKANEQMVLPAFLPLVSLHNAALEIRGPDYQFFSTDSSLQIDQTKDQPGQAVRILLPHIHLDTHEGKKMSFSCMGEFAYKPGQLRIARVDIANGLASLKGSLDWSMIDKPLLLELQADLPGAGYFKGSGSHLGSRTSLQLNLKDIDLAQIAQLVGYEGLPLAGKLSGNIDTMLDSAVPDRSTAAASVNLQHGNLFGVAADVELAATLREGFLHISQLRAEYGKNKVGIARAVAPLSLLTDWHIEDLPDIDADVIHLHLENLPGFLALFGLETSLTIVPKHVLDASGRMTGRVINIENADLKTNRNTVSLHNGRLQFMAKGQSFLDSIFNASLHLHAGELEELASLFALPSMGGALDGDISLTGAFRRPFGTLDLKGKGLMFRGSTIGDLRIEAKADKEKFHIVNLKLRNGEDLLKASGVYLFDTNAPENINSTIFIKNIGRYASILPGLPAKIAGHLEATVFTLETGGARFDVKMTDAVWGDYLVSKLQGEVTTNWQQYMIKELELASELGKIRLSAGINPIWKENRLVCNLHQFDIIGSEVNYTLAKSVELDFFYDNKMMNINGEKISLQDGKAKIDISGSVGEKEETLLKIQGENLAGSGWLESLLGHENQFDGANFLFTLQGPLSSAKASLTAQVGRFAIPSLIQPLSGDITLDYSAGNGLTVRGLSLATLNGQQITVTGRLPFDPLAKEPFLATDDIDLQGKVSLPDLRGVTGNSSLDGAGEGEFYGEFRLAGSWEKPTGNLDFKGNNFYLSRLLRNAPQEPLTINGHVGLQAGILRLEKLNIKGNSLSCSMHGQWSAIPSLEGLIRHPPEGLPGTIDFVGQVSLQDIGWLTAYTSGLRRLSGQVHTAVRVHGPAAKPKFDGTINLTEGMVRLEKSTLPAIEKLEGLVELADNHVRLRNCNGVFGGAPFQVNGSAELHGLDTTLSNCRLTGKNLLFYRDETMKIRADADLVLKGSLRKLELGGSVVVVDGRYTKNVDFLGMFRGSSRPKSNLGMQLFSFTEPPWRDMLFDVRISAEKPFILANNMAKGAFHPNLHLTGTGELPLMTGQIFVDPTRISVPAGKIMIESGVISFTENDPDRPTFNLNGNSTLAGYKITMLFQGNSEEPVITLSSDPPLAEDQLLLLVLTGTLPQSDQEKTKRSMAGMHMAVYLGKGLLSKWFVGEPAETEESVLDRFELDFGRQLSKSGDETIEAQFRLVEGLFLPGDRLYLTSEKDMYDNFNFGVKIVFRFK